MNKLVIATLTGLAVAKTKGSRPTGLNSELLNAYNNYVGRWNKDVSKKLEFLEKLNIYEDNKRHVEETNARAIG